HPDLLTPRGVAWHRRMIGLAARAADAVVVPTLAVATELARHVDLRRVEVIGEGVAQAFAAPPPARAVAAVTTRLGLPERYLVAVGTLEPRKGLPTIIRALDQLPPDVHLAVVGPAGWGDATPEASDRVHLLGRLTDADLAAVVAGAAVSVHASRSEGFGLPLVEAMSVGTPVVHSAIDVFAEVAQLAGASFPVDDDRALADAVRPFLADDSKARTATASAGRAVAATHSWTNVAERLWDLYRELAADR
ncbi:MAG: glycosyltransferase, partial [Salana multivorans]|nr:glycosyltransferase [Salana multivorans]